MWLLILGIAVFLGIHLVPAFAGVRAGLVQTLGESGYKIVFSVLSLAGLVLLFLGYANARANATDLWQPPEWTRHLTMLLLLIAFICIAASLIPSRIGAALKHPMLTSIKIWALAHLLANGDAASIVLFGSFLAYAVFDRISLKRRDPAMVKTGRTGTLRGDILVIVAGVVAYVAMLLVGHTYIVGVPLLS